MGGRWGRSRNRGGSRTNPLRASARASRLLRLRPPAPSPRGVGAAWPAIRAASLARAETPVPSGATQGSWMVAPSRPCRDARAIGGDTGELDGGSFPPLLQAVDPIRPLGHPVGARAGEVAQVPLGTRRKATGLHPPLTQPVGPPGGILGIGLGAGDGLVGTGVDPPLLESALEKVGDRLPVLAGARHGDVRTAKLPPPGAQSQPGAGRGRKGAGLLLGLAVGEGEEAAGDDAGRVHIPSGTALKQEMSAGPRLG